MIKSTFERILQTQGFSPGAFLTWAKRNKKILIDDYGAGSGNQRLTKRKLINGVRVSCVALIIDNEEEKENDGYEVVEAEDLPF